MAGREPTIELAAYSTKLDEHKYTDQDGDNEVKGPAMRLSPKEVADCTFDNVLKHRKTAQLVRLFDQHRRTSEGGEYEGPEITVETLQASGEHHAELLDFIYWLPLRQSPGTAVRVRRIAFNTLQRIQQINALRAQAKRVEDAGKHAKV